MKVSPMRFIVIMTTIVIMIGFIPWMNFVIDTGRFPMAHEVLNWEFLK